MALRPTDPRISQRPPTRPGQLQRPELPQPPAAPAQQRRPRRLVTATSAAEIEAQVSRLLALIANDNIDPKAPPGSYLNMLV
jgi:hypothetical protein